MDPRLREDDDQNPVIPAKKGILAAFQAHTPAAPHLVIPAKAGIQAVYQTDLRRPPHTPACPSTGNPFWPWVNAKTHTLAGPKNGSPPSRGWRWWRASFPRRRESKRCVWPARVAAPNPVIPAHAGIHFDLPCFRRGHQAARLLRLSVKLQIFSNLPLDKVRRAA